MRKQYHWSCKLLAFVLVFVTAAAAGICTLTTMVNLRYRLYQADSPEEQIRERIEMRINNQSYETALYLGHEYLMGLRTGTEPLEQQAWRDSVSTYWGYYGSLLQDTDYVIRDTAGTRLASGGQTNRPESDYAMTVTQTVLLNDGILVSMGSGLSNKVYPSFEELTPDYIWTDFLGHPLPGLDSRTVYYEFYNNGTTLYRVERFRDMELTVELKLTQADVDRVAAYTEDLNLLEMAFALKRFDWITAAVSGVLLLTALVYLCFAAGKRPGTLEIAPRGVNRLPLDLSFCLWGGGGFGFIALAAVCFDSIERNLRMEASWILLGCFGLCIGAATLCGSFFLTALCAQVRKKDWSWLTKTLLARILGGCWKLVRKLWNGCLSLMTKLWSMIWGKAQSSDLTGKAIAALPKFGCMLKETYRNIHLCWQWVLLYGLLVVLTGYAASVFRRFGSGVMLIVAMIGFLIVLYTSYGFSKLRDAARRMSRGDLNTKINTYEEFLYGNFAEFAGDLNALGDTCVEAAMEKMKSERMKSELITNVSHDIKTPLTSIINYVDLLQKTDSEAERQEYLQVLQRQSQRLKKLIEDLMEMSKASSGNITVELAQNDIIEAVTQALGEFADRMAQQNLQVVFRQSGQSLCANFDGKLLWRVMSNILSNVVKYAMPGTRVYVDVENTDGTVRLSVKNISRESLNISAEELMERFVRGDESRNSEGNGLGLNIAGSLMEVQGGSLNVSVDGDLFKVILTLP